MLLLAPTEKVQALLVIYHLCESMIRHILLLHVSVLIVSAMPVISKAGWFDWSSSPAILYHTSRCHVQPIPSRFLLNMAYSVFTP